MGTNHDGKRKKALKKAQDLINMFGELQRLKGNMTVFKLAMNVTLPKDHAVTQCVGDAIDNMQEGSIRLETEILKLREGVKE